MGTCSRCGSDGEVQYGADGMAYCPSCIFYGMNKQCMRCRMYLPATELQQYRGMFACPYCLMDMREADRRESAAGSAAARGESCERCEKKLDGPGYLFNGRRLCSSCVQAEKDKADYYGGGPASVTPAIKVDAKDSSKKKSIIEYIVANVIGVLQADKRRAKANEKEMKPEIKYAKPMNEEELEKQKPEKTEEKKPEEKLPEEKKIIPKTEDMTGRMPLEEKSILAEKPAKKDSKKIIAKKSGESRKPVRSQKRANDR